MRPNYTILTSIRQGQRLLLLLGFILGIPLLIRAQNCTVKTGQLGNTKICLSGNSATIQASLIAPPTLLPGYQVSYVLTKGKKLVIQELSKFPFFTVKPDTNYTIHTLVYDPETLDLSTVKLGRTTGFGIDSLLIEGGGKICGALDLIGSKFNFRDCEKPCFAQAGRLQISLSACLQDGLAKLKAGFAEPATVPDGFQTIFLLSTGDSLIIKQLGETASFFVNKEGVYTIHTLVYDPKTLKLDTLKLGKTSILTASKLLIQGGGQICGALDITGARFNVTNCSCTAKAGSLQQILNECLLTGTAWIKGKVVDKPVVPDGYQVRYILTSGSSRVIEEISSMPAFGVTRVGLFEIHSFVYNPNTLNTSFVKFGKTTLDSLNRLLVQGGGNICAALDKEGITFDVYTCNCEAYAGSLKPVSNECLGNGTATLKAQVLTSPVVPAGFQVAYLLSSGNNFVVRAYGSVATFPASLTGRFTIHTLVYNPTTFNLGSIQLGITTINDLNKLFVQGGGQTCAALDLSGSVFDVTNCACTATTGTIKVDLNECLTFGTAWLKAAVVTAPYIPDGYQRIFALTKLINNSLVIQQTSSVPSFGVTTLGQYRIHTLIFNPNTLNLSSIVLGTTTAATVNGLLIQGGGTICGALDVAGINFEVKACNCTATTGTLKVELNECLSGGTAWLKAAVVTAPNIPADYVVRYVLTKSVNNNLVIQEINTVPTFAVTSSGEYRIHTLVFNPASLNLSTIVFGTTTAATINSQLVQGGGQICSALDLSGLVFNVNACSCAATPGTLKVLLNECLSGGTAWLKAGALTLPNIPQGYTVTYILSKVSGNNLVIQDLNTEPTFGVTLAGQYRIHTLIYNPSTFNLNSIVEGQTTIASINGKFVQGGGQICGAIDLTGASFEVSGCVCAATPGKLKLLLNECLSNGTAWLKADVLQAPNVPQGYQVRYLLTKLVNNTWVIQETGTLPVFGVTTNGQYRIHTIVYNSGTLNLGNIVLGTTTAGTVNGWLIQGGGQICAALDLDGVTFDVSACYCAATPGKLKVLLNECLSGGVAWLKASVLQAPTVPQGYQVRYVLTKLVNNTWVIQEVNTTPTFGVTSNGQYRIHTLVYNSSTLNLGNIILGTTTAGTVNGWLIQGGGQICAALDLDGVTFDVSACYCAATPGKLKLLLNECLSGGVAWLKASVLQAPTVPQGYQVRYVLTKLVNNTWVIQEVNTTPTFGVTSNGQYRIHTLVYNSSTLNLGNIILGTTTAGTVNGWLIQGGGQICAALDLDGVTFDVSACYCAATPGKLKVLLNECLSGGVAWLKASVLQAPTVPQGYQVRYVLTKLVNNTWVIQEVNTTPTFGVTSNGQYRIHTLVYNSSTLNLGNIVLGTTTAGTVNGWLIQGGGQICAALDLDGVTFDVSACYCAATPGKLKVLLNECLSGGVAWLKASVLQAPTVPQGYQVRYVLTKLVNNTWVIQEVNTTPTFGVTSNGQYRIHTLVYNSSTLNLGNIVLGTTTAGTVNGWLIQGGGQICAALDLDGVTFDVSACYCAATPGKLKVLLNECLSNGTAWLKADVLQAPTVPQGYQVRYLFSKLVNGNWVIQETGTSAAFGATSNGQYRIHTLVYNSSTLNLANIILGTTTTTTLKGWLIQGGGQICAALDADGIGFDVSACYCSATPGKLKVLLNECLSNGTAWLKADVLQAPTVPQGYQVRYLFSKLVNGNWVIQETGTSAAFGATSNGQYRIHTLVYNSSTLNLANIILGTTTTTTLKGWLIQGGGQICAALDADGIGFDVSACYCSATPGKLKVLLNECLSNGTAWLKADVLQSPTVPQGYQVRYVLSKLVNGNLVIQETGSSPVFGATSSGQYRIHTLVFNSNTLNIGNIVLGTTTIGILNSWLIQGGGQYCGALDVEGVTFEVKDCACPSQTIYSGTLRSILLECVNTEHKAGWLKAEFVKQPSVPQGYQVRYLLASGNNQIIQEIASMPKFGVENGGRYRILTLVYNPATLDLGKIKLGITTVGDLNKTLIQGGGNICAELDLDGVVYDVFNCDGTDGPCDIEGGKVTQVTGACLKNGPTYIVAKVVKKPVAPANYKVVYLLTTGTNQTIVDFSGEPTFFLGAKGRYGINTLVYDPNYLNLREAIKTLNTIAKLSTFFYQGGGRHCGAVELGGAVYNLDICDCDFISSGAMYARPYSCWKGGKDSVVLNSLYKIYGSPVTTGNFKNIYLLTTKDSLKIIGINYNTPEFKIGQVGRYRIHSLVYDAKTLDLKIIKFGKTTAFDIHDLLRQGDGKICASLDMNGALFDVVKCESSQSINSDKTKLYPNPTTDLLNLQFSQDNIQGDGNIQVEILDFNGKRFNQLTFAPGTTNSELNIGQLPSGMYMVKISYGNSILEMLRFSKL